MCVTIVDVSLAVSFNTLARISSGVDALFGCRASSCYIDRLMDITLTAERSMENNSQVMEAVFVASRPTA